MLNVYLHNTDRKYYFFKDAITPVSGWKRWNLKNEGTYFKVINLFSDFSSEMLNSLDENDILKAETLQ